MAKLFHSYITGCWQSRRAACEINVLHWTCCINFVVSYLALFRHLKCHECCFVAQSFLLKPNPLRKWQLGGKSPHFSLQA